jgi:hypothetical protein
MRTCPASSSSLWLSCCCFSFSRCRLQQNQRSILLIELDWEKWHAERAEGTTWAFVVRPQTQYLDGDESPPSPEPRKSDLPRAFTSCASVHRRLALASSASPMEQDHTGRGGGRHRTHLGATAMCRGWQLRHAGGGGEESPKERETLEREMRNVEDEQAA